MSYQESTARRRSNQYLRTSMDIGMGVFYTAIGSLIIYAKAFGNMTIPPAIAYILGGMMVVGGLFRFIRGVRAALPKKKDAEPSGSE
jgi:hypothetical protein